MRWQTALKSAAPPFVRTRFNSDPRETSMQQINLQPIQKQQLGDGQTLEINSIFWTLQGEGPYNGHPAIFIRLAGCNLQCPSCDTEYQLKAVLSLTEIYAIISRETPDTLLRPPIIVITGGEPFRQNIAPLVDNLLQLGYKVQIETNGTLYVPLEWSFAHKNLTIVCSPKTGKINKDLLPHIKALKYVVNANDINRYDGLPNHALGHPASPMVARPPANFRGEIFVQPVDVKDEVQNKRHLDAAVDSCLRFGYRFCLQVHKLIGVE